MSSEIANNAPFSVIQPDSSSESMVNTNDTRPQLPIPEPRLPHSSTPSPLTMPSIPSNNESSIREREMVSIRNVSFIENERGHHLSVPQQPAALTLHTYNNPYDSDGEEGPFFDAVLNELDYSSDAEDDNEAPIQHPPVPATHQPIDSNLAATATANPIATAATQPVAQMQQGVLTEEIINKMSVNQLKEELRKRNKSTTGVKKILQERLLGAIDAPVGTTAEIAIEEAEAVPGFAPGAKWVNLKPNQTAVEEPNNSSSNLVGPTVPTGAKEKDKFDYSESFDRPPFTAMSRVVETLSNGKVAKDRKGDIKWKQEVRATGRANIDWVESRGLTEFSAPNKWFGALLPEKKKRTDPRSMVSIAEWTTYSNTKALLLNAGQPGYLYPDWKPFTVTEIKKFIGLYILQGLSPSPQVKMKFKPQSIDAINGSDLCSSVFGENAEKRHKQFKSFFAVQNPLLPVPSKTTHPNWKVDPFLAWVQTISMEAWDVGSHLSGDEQTIGFKGNHADKQRISYKKEGDGFLADAIAEDGYTYTFFFRNMPAPKKYIDMKLSPLHARVLFMFNTLKEKHCTIGLDNLYISARFVREAFISKSAVMVHGVARKSGRGLPKYVIQEEIKNAKEAEKVRGTTKAAVLEGDPECPNMVAFSVYDTKPVHFLTMAATNLKWVEKCKRVFDKAEQRNVSHKFLRCQVIDEYNNGMNGVDVADQLRGSYRIDRWMKKRKWWWSIWMWGVQLLLVNAYILYKSTHLLTWKKNKKTLLSHYEFRSQIALAWLTGLEDTTGDQDRTKKRKKIDDSSSSTPSLKSRRVNDASLSPTNGALRSRLDSDYHYPVPAEADRPCCSVCRWLASSRDEKVRSNVFTCDRCNVSLCIDCFKPFHTIADVRKLRSEVVKRGKLKKR
jgi:Transposase IS4/SAP domain